MSRLALSGTWSATSQSFDLPRLPHLGACPIEYIECSGGCRKLRTLLAIWSLAAVPGAPRAPDNRALCHCGGGGGIRIRPATTTPPHHRATTPPCPTPPRSRTSLLPLPAPPPRRRRRRRRHRRRRRCDLTPPQFGRPVGATAGAGGRPPRPPRRPSGTSLPPPSRQRRRRQRARRAPHRCSRTPPRFWCPVGAPSGSGGHPPWPRRRLLGEPLPAPSGLLRRGRPRRRHRDASSRPQFLGPVGAVAGASGSSPWPRRRRLGAPVPAPPRRHRRHRDASSRPHFLGPVGAVAGASGSPPWPRRRRLGAPVPAPPRRHGPHRRRRRRLHWCSSSPPTVWCPIGAAAGASSRRPTPPCLLLSVPLSPPPRRLRSLWQLVLVRASRPRGLLPWCATHRR